MSCYNVGGYPTSMIDVLRYLLQLQVSPDHFVLLLLQGRLRLLQGGLQFVFLQLKSASLAVQLMDGLPTLAQLVQQVLDLVRQVLVLSSDTLKVLDSLIPGSLE